MRYAFGFLALITLTACGSKDAPKADTSSPPSVTQPTIWLQPSSSIQPTELPLRDQRYTTEAPKPGYVYVCDPKMFQQIGAPGAVQDGNWVHSAAGTYDVTTKLFFQGNVFYPAAEF